MKSRNVVLVLIDVVKKTFFPEFLKAIEADIEILGAVASYERQIMKEEKKQ